MYGCQITFYTQQDRMHRGKPLGRWLIEEANRLGVAGATMLACVEGFGHSHRIHSTGFFDLSDQPVAVVMALTDAEAAQMLARLAEESVEVFWVRVPAEFGTSGAA